MSEEIYDTADLAEVPCPLCRSEENSFFGQERGLKFVRCEGCGLLYVNPRLSHNKLTEIYTKYYHTKDHWQNYLKDHNISEPGQKKTSDGRNLWEKRYNDIWKEISKNKFPEKFSCLDVGAGSSSWSRFISEKTSGETWTFDIAENYNLKSNDSGRIKNIVAPTLERAELPEKYFDLITSFDVIEHYEDPTAELIGIRKHLKDNGVLFIQTPNAAWISLKYNLKTFIPDVLRKKIISDYGILLPEQHLQYYSMDTLQKQLDNCGFEVIENFNIDWSEPSQNFFSKTFYKIALMQSKLTEMISSGRVCTNIGLSVIAKKKI